MPYKTTVYGGDRLCDRAYEDEAYRKMSEGAKGERFTIVTDGMSGEYIVFGELIEMSNEYEGFNFNEIVPQPQGVLEQIKAFAETIFPNCSYHFDLPKLLVFTHYS
jgi:hypothetical protein